MATGNSLPSARRLSADREGARSENVRVGSHAHLWADDDPPADGSAAALVAAAPSVFEPNQAGVPVTWVGVNAALGDSHEVTWSIAQWNYPDDAGTALFSHVMPAQFVTLAQQAAAIWASVADVDLVQVADAPSAPAARPDVRVGLADLSTSLQHPTIGFTHWHTVNAQFAPDTLVTIEDPSELGVTALATGDFQYAGFQASVLQDLLHEMGHALGLGHNPADPTAIMNPVLSSANPMPDAQDIGALQALYGPPRTEIASAAGIGFLPG